MENNKQSMTFGQKLKSARKNAGLTQEQLALKLMLSRQAITKWEASKKITTKKFEIGEFSLTDCGVIFERKESGIE